MKTWWLSVLLCGLAMAVKAEPAPLQIDPPLGLHWGETQEDVESTSPPVTQRAAVKGRDEWTVEGFTQQGLKRAILYFGKEKALDEVELQYEEPNWTFDDYQAFFASARDSVRQKYGEPIVLARYKEPNHQQNVIETLVDLQWRSEGGSVQLCFYSAERDTNTWRMISLTYRAMNANEGNGSEKSSSQAATNEGASVTPAASSPQTSPTPRPQKSRIVAMRRTAAPKPSASPTPAPSAEERRKMKEQALKDLAAENLKEQNTLKAEKQQIDQQIRTTTGTVREEWKDALAKWKLAKAQAHADEETKKKAVEEKFK
jgi:hypothetical protein